MKEPGGRKNNKGYSTQNAVNLVRGGRPYFDCLIGLIRNAQHSIHLQCYIYDDDVTGREVADALKDAADRGVAVYLLADGYASQVMSRAFIQELRDSGINFRYFEPLFRSKSFYFGRRMHHKVFVADAFHALVGGVNISDHYNDLPGQPGWLDFAVYVQGEIASSLCMLCWKTWFNFSTVTIKSTRACKPTHECTLPAGSPLCAVRMRRNDWVRAKNEISASYVEMLKNAEQRVTIVCSYFLPGQIIRRLLKQASKRGVQIRVVIAGPSDVKIAKHAERWMYDWLLRNKIEIYEYQPNILHAKVAVCDGQWMTIGSYNINVISAYASIELNLDIKEDAFCLSSEKTLEGIIEKDCVRVTTDNHQKSRNWAIQLLRWSSYQAIRMMFYLMTFYFKQKK